MEARFDGNAWAVMVKWSLRQVAVIALGLLFALSASTLAVQASSMGSQVDRMISAAMGVEHQAPPDCAGGKAVPVPCKDMVPSCFTVCGASPFAVLVEPQSAARLVAGDELYLPRVVSLLGSSTPPNPPPPRTTHIG
jgi:hypothetical protein